MKAINISRVTDLSNHFVLDNNKELTRPILDEFNKGNYDYIIVKNIDYKYQFMVFDASQMQISFDFILSREKTINKTKYSLTLTELKSKVNREYADNETAALYEEIVDSIRDVLNEIHYEDEECVKPFLKDKEVLIDLDFCIEVRAQDSGSTFNNFDRLYIEKILFSC